MSRRSWYSHRLCERGFVPKWCEEEEMDRERGRGSEGKGHSLMKVSGLSRWGSLETGPFRKDGNASSHDSSQRHPSPRVCVCV